MNNKTSPSKLIQFLYRWSMRARRLLGKQSCSVFGELEPPSGRSINRICVINLDRQPDRWKKIERELSYVRDESGAPLMERTVRVPAVDASQFQSTITTQDVERTYSLRDQLFVDPRQVLPPELDLDEEIEMSRQEVAIALSHIRVWRAIADGKQSYALVLEDDVCFRRGFAGYVERVWQQLCSVRDAEPLFDLLFLSFEEVEEGAEKTRVSEDLFKLFRGIWFLSGYVVSETGAQRLLDRLPVRGPVDLWVNHQFGGLEALMTAKPVISQRPDIKSGNSYSVLPVLSKIGVVNSEGPGTFRVPRLPRPIFAIGENDSGLTSLAMALSMLGYRCSSDINTLPAAEEKRLFQGSENRVFDAFVNVGSLTKRLDELAAIYPEGRLIVASRGGFDSDAISEQAVLESQGADMVSRWPGPSLVLSSQSPDKWKELCEFIGAVPPASPYPELNERGSRKLRRLDCEPFEDLPTRVDKLESDDSPWVANLGPEWSGVAVRDSGSQLEPIVPTVKPAHISDCVASFDNSFWYKRADTFPGNMALFSPSNAAIGDSGAAALTLRKEEMGVRPYSAGALTTRSSFLYGRFEAVLKPCKVTGGVTGVFLHRDSPRQEIDIELLGKDPDKMLVNVFYNPGGPGARFDYGYRGTPAVVDLGFDATAQFHEYAIEWGPNEIRWFVDDQLVHRRVNWAPTPVPHLPMKFHLNLWPSRSHELAGELDRTSLPGTTEIENVRIAPAHVASDND